VCIQAKILLGFVEMFWDLIGLGYSDILKNVGIFYARVREAWKAPSHLLKYSKPLLYHLWPEVRCSDILKNVGIS